MALILKRHASNTLWFVLEIALVAGTSLLGSLFSQAIGTRASYVGSWQDGAPIWGVTLFWSVFVITAIFAGVRHWALFAVQQDLITAQNRLTDKQSRAIEQLQSVTQEMIETVRTQPQSSVLARFNALYRENFERYRRLLDAEPSELGLPKLEQAIRDALADICELARLFNPHHSSGGYGANIMLQIPMHTIAAEERSFLQKETQFLSTNQGFDRLYGVLRLIIALSCDNNDEPNDSKKTLRPLCLPIPETVKAARRDGKGDHWFVLPGAPRALVSYEPSQVPDVRQIHLWCQDNTSFDRELIERIDTYMTDAVEAGRFGAFYSLPLPASSWGPASPSRGGEAVDEPSARPIGIINIESIHPGLFSHDDPAKDFSIFVEPFLILVAELLGMVLEADHDYAKRPSEEVNEDSSQVMERS